MKFKHKSATIALEEGPDGSVVGGIEAVKEAITEFVDEIGELYGEESVPDPVQLTWFTSLRHPFIHRKAVLVTFREKGAK